MSYKTAYKYKGWTLVNTGNNYYSACKGNVRVGIGSIRRGDLADLTRRFREKIDELEARYAKA